MNSKSSKYTLLNKNQGQSYDMIEMVDLDPNKKYTYPDKKQTYDMQYVNLEDQTEKDKNANKHVQNVTQAPKQQPAAQKKPTQVAQQAVNYPTYSANPNPNKIHMNGTSFQKQNAPPQKKTKIPEMKVACNSCTFEQQVPANTQVYVCCCCNNMNECFPLYGLFICGYCQSKVCYPYGTSQMIRCTRCGTVNKVPTEPQKKYVAPAQPKVQQSKKKEKVQKKVEKYQQRQEKEVDFFGDEEIIEQHYEPQRPKNTKMVKQQEISFDQIPSLDQVQQKQLNYPKLL